MVEPKQAATPLCRACGQPLELSVVDLGMSPLCESFLTADDVDRNEMFYPLHVRACERCWLVQLPEFVAPDEIFGEYAYFSGYSTSWVDHAARYVAMIRRRLVLGPDDLVVELASNDGYLLQHFVGTDVMILGIDPARNVALAAEARGVPTLVEFFGRETASRLVASGKRARLVVGNNVLAQVPDLNDFLAGVAILLRHDGVATFEFPHLLRLIQGVEYDTIYHEHYSYFSLQALIAVLARHGLEPFDVEELSTHGGSLRVYAQRAGGPEETTTAVAAIVNTEVREGLFSGPRYLRFARDVEESKRALLELLIRLRRDGKRVVGYGAPGKGNTLLNYCGIRADFLDFTVDRNPYKHGRFTPGTHIPIHPVERLSEARPDYVLVLPWNLVGEISAQLSHVSEWGARLIVPIPVARVIAPGERPATTLDGEAA